MKLAPITLFVYNRPWHTEQTLKALSLNKYSDNSKLYVYCDGPKYKASKQDLNNIQQVRSIVKKKNWCREVVVIENDTNLGLANSVINGVSDVIKKHGRVIVIEDDIVTSKYFLEYMNRGLECYKEEDEVYGVSGYCFPSKTKVKEETFFLPIMSSWGYGTWEDRWSKINFNEKDLFKEVQSKGLESKINFGRLNYYQMLKAQVDKRIDSWAVRFYVSMYLDRGVFLFPNISLLQNIGFDGSGIHCNKDDSNMYYLTLNKDVKVVIAKKNVRIDSKIIKNFKSIDLSNKKKMMKYFKKLIKNIVAPEIIQLLKRKIKNDSEMKRFVNFPRYTKTTITLKDKEIEVPDNASFLCMYKEIFEDHIYKFITTNKEPYIIDGGANIGLSTIYLKLLYPNSKIVAFEPDPFIYEILKKNIKVFDFIKDVQLINKGLWNEDKILSFYSEGADAGLIQEGLENSSEVHSIDVVSLKSYLNRKVDFLKLDIEGAEINVLKDIESQLVNVDRIFVEYHSFVDKPQELNEVINILTKEKFRLYMSIPGGNSLKSPLLGLRNYNGMDLQLNIFGVKNGII